MIATSWTQDKIMIQLLMLQSATSVKKPGTHQIAPLLKSMRKKNAICLILTTNTALFQEILGNGSEVAALELKMIAKPSTKQTRMRQPLIKLSATMICATLWTHLPPQDLLNLPLPMILPAHSSTKLTFSSKSFSWSFFGLFAEQLA